MKEYLHSFTKLEFDKIIARLASLAATDLGKSKIQTIRSYSSLAEIQSALKCVTEMRQLLESDTPPSFDGIVDCRTSVQRSRITDNVLTAPELRQIADLLTAARKLKSYFAKRESFLSELSLIVKKIKVDKILEFNINNAINEQDEIRDSASKKLADIRAMIRALRDQLKRQLELILTRSVNNGWAQEEIITTRDGRMVIPVKVEYKHQIPGFIHSASSSGATVFIEPTETLEMNNEIRSLLFEEQREIHHILKDLTSQLRVKSNDLLETIEVLENLDMIYAKARYSIVIHGSEVNVQFNTSLALIEARHPLLIEQRNSDKVVPLNIEIGKNYHTLVISGPNAGGKSVALKTVGLIVVMVYHGMHTPALPDSVIPIFERLFVDIGDEQSIEHNLSTFTSHLSNLKLIYEEADSSSLVLIDEISSGTDPSEGGALAAAILQKLTQQQSFTITTTHNSFLKAFAADSEGVENASMEFDQHTLTPTYNLHIGIPGSSYAFEIAKRLEISDNLLTQAKMYLGIEGQKLAELISSLEDMKYELQQELEKINKKQMQLNKLIQEYQSKLSSLNKEETEIRRKALEDAKQIIDQSNSIVEQTIHEIREYNAERQVINRVKNQLQAKKEELSNALNEVTENDDRNDLHFSVGDLVKFKSGNEIGEVLDIVDKNTLVVFSGISKIKVQKNQLIHIKVKKPTATTLHYVTIPVSPRSRVDIRGMHWDQAIGIVDKFIDDAIVSGLKQIEIIHGKGTGSLRKKTHDFLRSHFQVKSFRLGDWSEGGLGITIIELK